MGEYDKKANKLEDRELCGYFLQATWGKMPKSGSKSSFIVLALPFFLLRYFALVLVWLLAVLRSAITSLPLGSRQSECHKVVGNQQSRATKPAGNQQTKLQSGQHLIGNREAKKRAATSIASDLGLSVRMD